jgi:hypothetical protein
VPLNSVPLNLPLTGEVQKTADLLIAPYTIPFPGSLSERTTYVTFALNFPDDSADLFHVIWSTAVVNTPRNLHHFRVVGCGKKFPDEKHGKEITANEGSHCQETFGQWAPGKKLVYTPPWAGLPIGKSAGVVAFRADIHYDNPAHEKGVVATDGFRIHYTPTLRNISMGEVSLIDIASNSRMEILPGGIVPCIFSLACVKVTVGKQTPEKMISIVLSGS